MLSLGKFKPSLGISALKKSVSESRISQKYDGLGISDFENADIEISPMGRSIFYRKLIRNEKLRNLPLSELDKIMVLIQNQCFGMSGKVFVVTPAKAKALLFLVMRLGLGVL